ncbi:MAG: hypothetical protein EAZ60_03890 [Oscillatoriales cyanobacterium]|nr:MAG: hypothetical protein EAZ60_03890 [Oscillatoriales cyanobacterium]TAG73204.1 MAG: hypothetical protein EAZ23_11195 [Oscillatoriales cyanobacterium]
MIFFKDTLKFGISFLIASSFQSTRKHRQVSSVVIHDRDKRLGLAWHGFRLLLSEVVLDKCSQLWLFITFYANLLIKHHKLPVKSTILVDGRESQHLK